MEFDPSKFKDVLENIEKALNQIGDGIEKVTKKLEAMEPTEADLKKAGAKFSAETLSKLRSLRTMLDGLLSASENSGGGGGGEPTSKELTPEEVTKALQKGILEGSTVSEKTDDESAKLVKGIIESVMKSLAESKK